MLTTLKDILGIAEERKIAVGAFNVSTLEALQAIIGAAEGLDLPVITAFAQGHEPMMPISLIGPIMLDCARKAKVPVCVHLDHGESLEYLQKALDIGFTGVMYDGSRLPFEENLKNTQKAVAMARKAGASVEAELGSMGRRESGLGTDGAGEGDETKVYTDPEQAARFVREAGIDALACSFGTTHGIYLKEPRLDFDVVRNVRRLAGGIPVVMHGGSGVSATDFRSAIEAGVRKINYFTYMDKAGGTAAAEYFSALKAGEPAFLSFISVAARDAMQADVAAAMKTFAML